MTQVRLSFTVTEQDTARALGSGDVEVLATPRLLAWCEAATCVVASEVIADAEPVVGTVAGPGSAEPGSAGIGGVGVAAVGAFRVAGAGVE